MSKNKPYFLVIPLSVASILLSGCSSDECSGLSEPTCIGRKHCSAHYASEVNLSNGVVSDVDLYLGCKSQTGKSSGEYSNSFAMKDGILWKVGAYVPSNWKRVSIPEPPEDKSFCQFLDEELCSRSIWCEELWAFQVGVVQEEAERPFIACLSTYAWSYGDCNGSGTYLSPEGEYYDINDGGGCLPDGWELVTPEP